MRVHITIRRNNSIEYEETIDNVNEEEVDEIVNSIVIWNNEQHIRSVGIDNYLESLEETNKGD